MIAQHPTRLPRSPRPDRWTLAISGVLVAVFVAIGWIQARQFKLLDTAVYYVGENIGSTFSQLEIEYMKLRDSLRQAERYPEQLDAQALRERYEIFVSRISLVQPERIADFVAPQPEHLRTVGRIREFVSHAEPFLSEAATARLTPEVIAGLLYELAPLADPVHDLTLVTTQAMGEAMGERNAAARQQSRISLALTIFQGLLTLAFASLLIRQVHGLKKRRSELQALAEGLQEARRGAEVANEAKSAFLANMSHELRTPLSGLLDKLSLIGSAGLDARQLRDMGLAETSARQLAALVSDILDVSQLESHSLRVSPADTNLHELLAETESLTRSLAQAKGLRFALNVTPAVPRWVWADAGRLKQILRNLLSNAVKFSDQGAISLDVDVAAPAAQAARGPGALAPVRLRLVVRDQGIGMDAATQAGLFERFFVGGDSISRRHGGSGLGLTLARNLAQLMQGDIAVQSQPGQGSVFTVEVELACLPGPSAARLPAPPATVSRVLDILVVEDQAVNRELMQALLAKLGHRVRFAEDGAQALAEAARLAPDLVLMDLHMPVMDGLTVTRILRAGAGAAASMPIVALTAEDFEKNRAAAVAAGMNAFLPQPVSLSDMQALLVRLFAVQETP